MATLRGRIGRLEALTAGNTVSLQQRNGTTRTFPTGAFKLGLFVAATDAACGVVPSGPVVDAFNNATPEARGASNGSRRAGRRATSCVGTAKGGCWRWPTPSKT